jgi:hypothetical protein
MSFRILGGLAFCLWLFGASLPAPAAASRQQPEDLPPGKGRDVLEASCTSCHEFEEIMKHRGKYGRDDWRTVVRTMVDYGAQVDAKDIDVLVEYLAQHLGKPADK